MSEDPLITKLAHFGVIPVIAVESAPLALPLADALAEGGLPVAEITFRTQAAGEAIQILKQERPEILVGAGTLLTVGDLLHAKEQGAQFGVAPGFNPELVKLAQHIGFPFFPGVITPSEIEKGLSMGIKQLKYFPAEASGGVSMLKAVSAPFAHLGVRFIPTGGVNMDNLEAYLNEKSVLAVGGTWIASKAMISGGKWDSICDNVRRASACVRKIRGS